MSWDFLDKLELIRPFSEAEAWLIFKIAALSEAFGWTLLITGILINRYHLPGKNIAIPIAGQIHGTIFLVYFGVVLVVYTSLGWPRKRFIFALLAGVPPYGTLVFEQWVAHKRKYFNLQAYFWSIFLASIADKDRATI